MIFYKSFSGKDKFDHTTQLKFKLIMIYVEIYDGDDTKERRESGTEDKAMSYILYIEVC